MPIEKLKPGHFFDEERLAKLREIVPEAFSDNKINWTILKEALGEYLEEEDRDAEHFGLFWPGKREARRLASIPSKGTLVPAAGEGIDEEKTSNVFIEGENLEVLKILRKSYTGRIKMIYIDPPYNTGNDKIYDDDFTEPLDDYLKRTGQIDGEGRVLTTNKKSDGRFHSKWLSMMCPRLRLARELLREDGVLFVSIDDNEVHNLRAIINEIFGEECFLSSIIWQKRTSPEARASLGAAHDYIVCFVKANIDKKSPLNLLPLSEQRKAEFKNPDNDSRGLWASVDLTGQTGHATKSQFYIITTPTGIKYSPPDGRCWALAEETFNNLVSDKRIWFGIDGNSRPRLKQFLSETEGMTSWTWWTNEEVGHNQEATKELYEIFQKADIFDNPKPTRLIKRLLNLASNKENSVILDFFSGSATTAHAMLDLNIEDGGNRKFILVQLPEETDEKSEAFKAGYKTIAEIGKERIRRVIKQIKKEMKENKGLFDEDHQPDLGFKVLKLTSSNFKTWENYHGEDTEKLEELFEENLTPLVEDWKEDGLLTEILLLEGFPLDSMVTLSEGFKKNKVFEVSSALCGHRLLVCLDEKIDSATIKTLDLHEQDVFVCLDTAVTDEAKSRLADKGLIKTI